METQTNMKAETKDIKEGKQSEREFLRDLHVFMGRRATPIDRIPSLGSKEVDLYKMYKTVMELGGYLEVTTQKMWKKVYKVLGGNPRSTCAATCTRRHYEKLLLPYECNKKGVSIAPVPRRQPKPIPFSSFCKEDRDGQTLTKKRQLSMCLQQEKQNLESGPGGKVFSMMAQDPPPYRPRHTVQAPSDPTSSRMLTSCTLFDPQHLVAFHPSPPNPTERAKQPLEKYKTSLGLAEPLNLSVKESNKDTNSNSVYSFPPPSLHKNPKVLNQPSTLYPSDPSQESEAGLGNQLCAPKEREVHVVDFENIATSSSPRYVQRPTTSILAQKPVAPKTDFMGHPKEEGYPDARDLNLSQIMPTWALENGGRIEIKMPLSALHNLLRLCKSTAAMQGLNQPTVPPFVEEQSHRSEASVQPINPTFQTNIQYQTPVETDLNTRKRSLPSSPAPAVQMTSPPLIASQNPSTSYMHLPSDGFLKNTASQDVFPFNQQAFQTLYASSTLNSLGSFGGKDTQTGPTHMTTDSCYPVGLQHDFTDSLCFCDNAIGLGNEMQEEAPSTFIMCGSTSTPVLQLTSEELLKLKKIISSS